MSFGRSSLCPVPSVTNDTPDLPPDGKKDAGERAGKGTEVIEHNVLYVVVIGLY
jgi:hypothetical protein